MKRKFFAFATVICMLCALTLCASAAGFYGENASGDQQGSLLSAATVSPRPPT